MRRAVPIALSTLLVLLAAAPADAATDAERLRAAIQGLVFFAGLFGLALYAGIMRLRDARAGLAPEARRARMQRRLPWLIGGLLGLTLLVVL